MWNSWLKSEEQRRHFGSNLRKQFVWWLMQPAWKSFSPSPPPAWWPSWQSRTSLWQAWDAPSQRWNSLVVQRSRVSWQHQAPSKRVANSKEFKEGKDGNLLEPEQEDELQWNFSFAQLCPGNHLARVNLQQPHNIFWGNSHFIQRKSTLNWNLFYCHWCLVRKAIASKHLVWDCINSCRQTLLYTLGFD